MQLWEALLMTAIVGLVFGLGGWALEVVEARRLARQRQTRLEALRQLERMSRADWRADASDGLGGPRYPPGERSPTPHWAKGRS